MPNPKGFDFITYQRLPNNDCLLKYKSQIKL